MGTDWRGLGANVARISEEFRLDPLGNVLLRRTSVGADEQHGEMPRYENFHIPNTGRLHRSRKLPPSVPSSTWTPTRRCASTTPAATCRAAISRWAGSTAAATG